MGSFKVKKKKLKLVDLPIRGYKSLVIDRLVLEFSAGVGLRSERQTIEADELATCPHMPCGKILLIRLIDRLLDRQSQKGFSFIMEVQKLNCLDINEKPAIKKCMSRKQ